MFLQSGGALVRKGVEFINSDGTPWTWSRFNTGSVLGDRWGTYGEIYRTQLWVAVLVNKLAKAQARLPLPVYQRLDDGGRQQVRDHPYAQLLRNPSSKHDPFMFYQWTVSCLEVYGSAAWGKLRDSGGRPRELVLLHPAALTRNVTDGVVTWRFANGTLVIEAIPDHDIVHFHTYHPDSPSLGLSPLESLRATLENEANARAATSSFWANGARPGVALTHPGNLSTAAAGRLKVAWNELAAGADKTGKTVVLEEGMKAQTLTLTAEEAQYIESRKLNREEVCAAYDVPPPVVHILDHATFSNITEQMRSMYRDSVAPRLSYFESVLEAELRASVRPGQTEPDFGADVYAEFLLDEVLRGDFEVRSAAKAAAINSGQLTLNEARRMDNLPAIEGGDRLFINSTMVPVEAPPLLDLNPVKSDRAVDTALDLLKAAPSLTKDPGLPMLVAQLRAVLDGRPMPLPPPAAPAPAAPVAAASLLPAAVARKVMGRLSRPSSPMQVDAASLADGLDEHAAPVLLALVSAQVRGEDMPALRARIAAITEEKP